jgi:hypothetical protein
VRVIILGNPDNRRVGLFQAARERAGQTPASVISWFDLAEEGAPERIFDDLPKEPAFVRIDSFGEDFATSNAFHRRGFDDARSFGAWAEAPPARDDRGLIFAPRQGHCGFLRVLAEVEAALAKRPWLDPLPTPAAIRTLFDKTACAPVFEAAGVPFPATIVAASFEELRARMTAPRAFVKLTCGSSASCIALYDREEKWLFTSMEIDRARLYNSLKPRRYRDRRSIERLMAFLFREGAHCEECVPKATSEDRYFDLRMLVIDDEVPFTVMRKSPHPVTNLHLGGVRGTMEELEALVPAPTLEAARASCVAVRRQFEVLHLGVDVMITDDLKGHCVLEANAFGDLLPNLQNDGRDVWDWQLQAIAKRRRARS